MTFPALLLQYFIPGGDTELSSILETCTCTLL